MPMSEGFKERLFPLIPKIARDFRPLMSGDGDSVPFDKFDCALSSGFHIYDERGIRETITLMKKLFFTAHSGTNFFSVKACPNIHILKIILEMGFGLDCASPTELVRAKLAGAKGHQVMYTSNNTNPQFYKLAIEMGCILNIDDVKLYGIYDHIYEKENYLENNKFGTHYVVIVLIYEDNNLWEYEFRS